MEHYGFARGNGGKLLAFWLPGVAEERGAEGSTLTTDVVMKGVKGHDATIIDLPNGTEKPLNVKPTTEGIVLRRIRVQTWPLIIKLSRSGRPVRSHGARLKASGKDLSRADPSADARIDA